MAFTHDGRFVAAWIAGAGHTISGASGTIAPGSPPSYAPQTIVTSTSVPGSQLTLNYTPQGANDPRRHGCG
jgi:hypothetical protein